jgi:hypothetical protein
MAVLRQVASTGRLAGTCRKAWITVGPPSSRVDRHTFRRIYGILCRALERRVVRRTSLTVFLLAVSPRLKRSNQKDLPQFAKKRLKMNEPLSAGAIEQTFAGDGKGIAA